MIINVKKQTVFDSFLSRKCVLFEKTDVFFGYIVLEKVEANKRRRRRREKLKASVGGENTWVFCSQKIMFLEATKNTFFDNHWGQMGRVMVGVWQRTPIACP